MRARAVIHTGRGMCCRYSDVTVVIIASIDALRRWCKSQGVGHVALATDFRYWTVIDPFMPIARCGVQWKLYVPTGTFANEIVYDSLGLMSIGLDKSPV